MNPLSFSHAHIIGIGGIGMSGVARMLHEQGCIVSGSDTQENSVTKQLRKLGVTVTIGHASSNVPDESVVVVSSAITPANPEYVVATERKLHIFHRAEMLAYLLQKSKACVVTGAHGKTTTTSMIATIFQTAFSHSSYYIGGKAVGLPATAKLDRNASYCAVEADESDGSFRYLSPFGVCITNMDYEHPDYWKEEKAFPAALFAYIKEVKGPVVLPYAFKTQWSAQGCSYGKEKKADLRITKIKMQRKTMLVECLYKNKLLSFSLQVMGVHNAYNAAAALAFCLELGIDADCATKALASFQGVEKRLQPLTLAHGEIAFFDYAHHPTEYEAIYTTLRHIAKGKRCVAIVEPHRFSRVRTFLKEFHRTLSRFDALILLPIHPASEPEEPGLQEALIEGITAPVFIFIDKMRAAAAIKACVQSKDCVVFMGATEFAYPLIEELKR